MSIADSDGGARFRGTLYRHGSGDGLGADLVPTGDGLSVRADVHAFLIPYAQIEARPGGFEGRSFELAIRDHEVAVIHLTDPALVFAIPEHADRETATRFAEAAAAWVRTKRSRLNWIYGAFAACAIAILLLVFAGDPLIDLVVARIPVSWETSLGNLAVEQLTAGRTLCEDPLVNAAVDEIGKRLVATIPDCPYKFKFQVVVTPAVNAFALPGGNVIVNTGLILRAESAEEVAGVLAHEIEHVLARHGMRGIVRQSGFALVLVALFGSSEGLLATISQHAGTLVGLKFSRAQETAADLGGIRTLERASIDPRGVVTFFARLAKEEGELQSALWLVSSHPPSGDRRDRILREIDARSGGSSKSRVTTPPFVRNWAEVTAAARLITTGPRKD